MPPRDRRSNALFLADIVIASRTVLRWIDGRDGDWATDEILQNAVLRQLLVIGEAASCVTDDVREKLSELPWRQIRGFRNHAVHAYFSLDWEIVREVAEVDLPSVERAVYRLITTEYPEVAAEL
ncbi:HepT-like ribonuclease domain-containing protein [Nocardia neocaledoniensis]|uniref:HepT-like ribonuclease domain-containing protein n=1 Tax=Nocardia TaxID=1817 RepID=UPI0024587CB8|nr:HepT-like ribonuclease domain-containing protein [Nocardia neocaledoniensis]